MKLKFVTILVLATAGLASGQDQAADKFITEYSAKNNFNGTILIEKNSGIVFRKSFGYANLAFRVANTPDTRYKVASITKAFTSVMILQLFEKGLIDPDKPFGTFLPGYKGPAGSRVTVRQLLNMTSGLRNMDEGVTLESALKNGMPHYQLPNTPQEMMDRYCSDSLVFEPGSKFDYNNANYIILGKIIEHLTGKSFVEVLSATILKPLNMENTGMITQETIIDKLADTYFYREDLKMLSNDLPAYTGNWYASGGMFSTVDDIKKFTDALFGNILLKKETLVEMLTPGHDEYGLGVWVHEKYEINGKMFTVVKRPGSIMGAQAMIFEILEDRTTIIILSNTATVNMDEFAADIAKEVVH